MPSDTAPFPGWELLVSWVAVVETGSVSEAAQRLGLSQAGVSQHVKQLESILATSLLDRSTRPALPTAAGQRLFEHAVALLRQAREMTESVRQLSRAKRTVVRLGCVDSFAGVVGPQLIRALSGSLHQVRLWSGLSPSLNTQFANRQLDVLVTTSDLASAPPVRQLALFSERCCVVLPREARLPNVQTLAELGRQLPFMRYSSRSLLGQSIDKYLDASGEQIERTHEFDATDPMLSLVAAGLGFAIATPMCLLQSRHFAGQLRVLALESLGHHGRPNAPLVRTFYLTFRDGEFGSLPLEIRDLVRVAVQRVIVPEAARVAGVGADAIELPGAMS